MAFFKFRWPLGGANSKGRDERPPASSQADSVEVLRRRARHRLIGAAVLVVAGVLGFPLLFDTQPRPIPVDIPIVIPDKNKTPALVLPTPAPVPEAAPSPARPSGIAADEEVVPPALPTPPVAHADSRPESRPAPETGAAKPESAKKEVVAEVRKEPPKAATKPAETKSVAKAEAKPDPRAAGKPDARPEAKAEARSDDAARAQALLEGRTVPDSAPRAAAVDAGRFIVQVGAYSDSGKAHEARLKLEKAGLKTYTQAVDTADGKRIRVRVGPFASRTEADKAAARIKGLDLPASVLTL